MTNYPPEEKPPFLGTWSRVYALMVLVLILLILLFQGITKYFS